MLLDSVLGFTSFLMSSQLNSLPVSVIHVKAFRFTPVDEKPCTSSADALPDIVGMRRGFSQRATLSSPFSLHGWPA